MCATYGLIVGWAGDMVRGPKLEKNMPHMKEPELHHYGAAVLVMGVVALAVAGGLLALVFA